MVKRFLLSVLLLCAPVAHAGPKKVIRKVAHVLANHVTLGIATGVSTGLSAAASFDCRHDNGPERCTAGYGTLRGTAIADGVFAGAMIALSEYGRKQKFKEWFVPELAVTVFNTAWATHEWRIHAKEADRSSVFAIHH